MIRKSKIWIISEFYFPILTSTGYYITEIAEFIAKNKKVNVITTDSRYNEKDEYPYVKNECRNGVFIHRIKSIKADKNSFFSRVIKLVTSSFQLFFKLLFSVRKNDQVLIVTNPAFLILLMPVLKLLRNVKYKVLVHDIFPENLAAIGKVKKTSLFYRFLKEVFNFAYSQADVCIAIGRDMKTILEKKNVNSSRIVVIPNWSDTNQVKPVNKKDTNLIKKLNIKDKFIFQFAGNLGYAQGLDNIIEAIKLVTNEKIHFLFIGSGAMENNIKEFKNRNSLNNLTHISFQKRSEQNDFLNTCDVSLVTLSSGMLGLGVPSKSYNIMATGKPILVIADNNSEISLCVKEFNIGWVAEPNNPKILNKLFDKIYKECVTENKKNIVNSRDIALEHFSKEIILNKYFNLFNKEVYIK
jgi:glycosyltransferase involved in cell wall biosynthesis